MVTRSHPSRRRGIAVALLASAGLLLAACGGNDPSATTEPATATTVADDETAPTEVIEDTVPPSTAPVFTNPPTTVNEEIVPVSGGTLVVGIEGESSGYNPTVDPWSNAGHNVAKAIFDPLAAADAEGKVVPYLAESITGNDDATVWTIVLRPDISFHNGEPLNAEAVRLNFQAVLDSAQYKDQLSLLAGMDLNAYAAKAMAQAAVEPVLLGGRLGAIFYIADCAYKSRATSLFCTSFNGQLNSKLCLPLPSFSVSSCACGTTTIRRPISMWNTRDLKRWSSSQRAR